MPAVAQYTIIVILGCCLFLPFLGAVHLFDWDEINFAECAREMIVTKDYLRAQIDFMPFWEKPPMFIWSQVLCMKALGVGEFAARLPNAIVGIATITTVFYTGKRVAGERVALYWVLMFCGSWLPHLYFKSGIIDPGFNLFIFIAFFQLYLSILEPSKKLHPVLAGLFLGFAVLTKGPVALLVAILSFGIYLIAEKDSRRIRVTNLVVIAIFVAVPFLIWMTSAAIAHGSNYARWFLSEFFSYQIRLFSTEDSDHGGPIYFHFVVLLLGCFPASVFLLIKGKTGTVPRFTKWMWVLFWVVLILFSVVKTKIVHYSSLCYFPLTYLAALRLSEMETEERGFKKWMASSMLLIGGLWSLLLVALPLVGRHKNLIVPYIQDPFAVGNLQANVKWTIWESIPGVVYFVAICFALWLTKKNFRLGIYFLAAVQILIIQFTILHFTPKIEAYTQRSAINFYSSFRGKEVYIQPLGFKSYANLFYAAKTPPKDSLYFDLKHLDEKVNNIPRPNQEWLMNGSVDRKVYFVCKVQDTGRYKALTNLKLIGNENGFVFFERVR